MRWIIRPNEDVNIYRPYEFHVHKQEFPFCNGIEDLLVVSLGNGEAFIAGVAGNATPLPALVVKIAGDGVADMIIAVSHFILLESLIPVVVDPILGDKMMLVTPKVKENAGKTAEEWKKSLEQRGGIENVKTPDVHTFLQHLVTFGIVKNADLDLYRKLVVGSTWRKQMPKLVCFTWIGS
ncbi:hypothetical protein POM88_041275 [Heracleum sosnowskyi]|uniref:FRIGIDA-like protein n=1 Tax=Heracleum sosnowskyi TaxID=360622 RepID=A0AAD8HG33_9APIA|nr:hypothetical protein POM88_041275 [Heracleum sosnowskyi]